MSTITSDKARDLGDLLDLVEALGKARAAAELVGYHPLAAKVGEALDFAAEAAGEIYDARYPRNRMLPAVLAHRDRAYFLDLADRRPRLYSLPFDHADEIPLDQAEDGR